MRTCTPARTRITAALIAGAAVIAAGPASAALVELTFSGQVTEILGAPHGQWANVVLGDDFMVQIVVDSKAEDLVPGSVVGRYAYESATITVGGYTVTTGPGPLNDIMVDINGGLFGDSSYTIQYYNPAEQWQGLITLEGPNALPNDLLPIDLDLAAFTSYRIMSFGIAEGDLIWGVRSFPTHYSYQYIPNPGVISVAISALILPRQRRHRK